MLKKVFGKKLNRNRKSRAILFRALVKAMILHGHIKTTKAKAQGLRPELEHLMGLVKKGTLSARRAAVASLGNDKKAVDMLFGKYSALAESRTSGFVRITLLQPRRGDNAQMVNISWTEEPEKII